MQEKSASKEPKSKISSKLRRMSHIPLYVDNQEYNIDIVQSDERRQLVNRVIGLLIVLDEGEHALVAFEENAAFLDDTYLRWLCETLENINSKNLEQE
jgi:hypothetical protein